MAPHYSTMDADADGWLVHRLGQRDNRQWDLAGFSFLMHGISKCALTRAPIQFALSNPNHVT